jgi:arylsulfatase A-like enzyme
MKLAILVPTRSLTTLLLLSVCACPASADAGDPGGGHPNAPASAKTAKPNVIVILSDDSGYNEFSMQGSKTIKTPRIDSIAQAGVRFTSGYVSGTVCSPTRAGLLTGRYQQFFGHEVNIPPVYSEVNGLPLDEVLLPAVMKTAGYRTMAFGKWHLGYAPKFHPMERGFDHYYGFLQGSRSYFPVKNPTRLNQLLNDREPVKPESFTYMTDELGSAAAKYIAQNKDQPFFMYLAFNATHGPRHTLPDDLAKAGGNRIAAMTMALDRAVGVVLDEVKKQGIWDNTLVIFLNDNGGAAGCDNAPLRGFKGSTWEGGIRVPFAIQWPAVIPAGKSLDYPVISLDVFPTAIAAAGIAKTTGKPLHGVDLIPFLTGKKDGRPHQTLFWKHGARWAVRDGDLKLVFTDDEGWKPGTHASKARSEKDPKTVQLYDLAKDVRETKNLFDSRREDAARLQNFYDEWQANVKPTPWGGSMND